MAVDEFGLRKNITLLELEKARNTVKTDSISSTYINLSQRIFENHLDEYQTIAFKDFYGPIKMFVNHYPRRNAMIFFFL